MHGIRSPAIWQERLRSKLKIEAPNLEIRPMGYGRYPLQDFLCLHGSRQDVIDRMRAQLEYLLHENPDAEITVVAHSFGTYLMSEVLKQNGHIRIHRILLCGSIVRENYEWEELKSKRQIVGAIANDYGTRDYWVVLASALNLGYGPSGFYGFKNVAVTDNSHNCGHSDFFTDEHLINYWVPFLLDGQVAFSDWNMKRDNYVRYGRIKGFVNLGATILIGFVFFLLIFRRMFF